MVPDDLHTVYGGVLGSHFLNILDAIAAIHPDGKAAVLALMNVRLHQIYLYYNPGLRLPASKEFFTERYSVPNYEWKAVMQVRTDTCPQCMHFCGRFFIEVRGHLLNLPFGAVDCTPSE